MTYVARALCLCALLLAACETPQHGQDVAPWPDSGAGPTPYTSAQIRAAHPSGTTVRWQMKQAGERAPDQVMEFVECGPNSALVRQWGERDGEVVGGVVEARSTWDELRDHARFDAEMTTREAATVTVAGGTFSCWLYSVREVARPGVVQRFFFAHERPGPPVLYVLTSDGEEQLRMELLDYRRGG